MGSTCCIQRKKLKYDGMMHLNNINAYKLFILAFTDLEQTYTVHKEIKKKKRMDFSWRRTCGLYDRSGKKC